MGMIILVLSVAVRWQALDHTATPRVLEMCIAAQAVPRAAMVALAWVSRPAGTGLGLALSSTLTTPIALASIAQGILAALACGLRPAVAISLGAYLVVRLARWYSYQSIGGVNSNILGATQQVLEIFVLVLFTCRACSW
jgi:cobalamin synthase